MLELENAKKEFENYTKNYDLKDENLNRKFYHTDRVMNLCGQIAESLNLTKEEIHLAKIIGLLHDIARFEQYTRYHTFSDSKSIDHGDLGVEILTRENFIRKFISNHNRDDIILKAIKNHNKYQIEQNLTEEELLFAKIIRDADKIDIYYETLTLFYKRKEEIQEIENGLVPEYIMEQVRQEKLVERRPNSKAIDRFMVNLCFVFDLNFSYSFTILQKQDYINKIINRFEYKKEETKIQIEEVRKIINHYIDMKQ